MSKTNRRRRKRRNAATGLSVRPGVDSARRPSQICSPMFDAPSPIGTR